MKPEKEWYAVQVEWNHEKAVAQIFEYKQIEQYLPLYKVRRKWADRYKTIWIPVFTNYIFCRIGLPEYMSVVSSFGVVGIVKNGKDPAPVSDKEISDLRQVVESGLEIEPVEIFSTGDAVRIVDGPLKGVEGRVLKQDKKTQLVVAVTGMNRAVRTTIPPEWAEHTEPNHHPVLAKLAARIS